MVGHEMNKYIKISLLSLDCQFCFCFLIKMFIMTALGDQCPYCGKVFQSEKAFNCI